MSWYVVNWFAAAPYCEKEQTRCKGKSVPFSQFCSSSFYLFAVLVKCRKLRDELRAKAHFESSEKQRTLPDGIPSDIVEVAELPETQVLEGMETIAMNIANQVLTKKGLCMDIPSRASTNQIYVKEWDRIVLGGKRSTRSFLNVKESRKTAITLRVLQLVHAVLVKRIHITKRDLFYTDVKLFVDQAESDGVLDDVATMIGCTRSNLHVVASDKGLVVGRIQFEEDGDFIDCTKMGVGGKAIPPYIDKIENVASDAEFILLVEKEAAYMRMAEDRFYHKYPCIIITAKGQPDVATRMFLSRITSELKIPVLGLVDRWVALA